MGEKLTSEAEVFTALAEASQNVAVNGIYQHFKDTTKRYKVLGFTLNKSEDEVDVLYEPQYGAGLWCNRLLREWVELVEDEDGMVPRYQLVEALPDEFGGDQADR